MTKVFSLEPYRQGGSARELSTRGSESGASGFAGNLASYLNPAHVNTESQDYNLSGERWFALDASRASAQSPWYEARIKLKQELEKPTVDNSLEPEVAVSWSSWKTPAAQDSSKPFQDIVQTASREHGVPVALINAVIKQESACNPKAKSHAGAMGLMQLMPGTAKQYGCQDAYDPHQNVMAGTAFLKDLLQRFDGNIDLALAGYNAGPGNVKKYGNTIPPFRETIDYVKKVKKNYEANLGMIEDQGRKFS